MLRFKREGSIRTYILCMFMVLMMMALAVSSSCLFDTKSTVCANGVLCPAGWGCTAKQDGCYRDGCGDGVTNGQEDCDDGNRVNGDGCDNDCTSKCGNGVISLDKNGKREECDDNNNNDGDGCDSNCTMTGCYNGIVTKGEQCDDGNQSDDDVCVDMCVVASCGDGHTLNGVEDCDDGNTITEECSYDSPGCVICDKTCHFQPGKLPHCGDGEVQILNEECDDGVNHCGECGDDCKILKSIRATGRITVVRMSDLNNGDKFVIDDGFNFPVTFVFNDSNPAFMTIKAQKMNMAGNSVLFGVDVISVRNAVIALINNSGFPLLIEATPDILNLAVVNLRHIRPTFKGNAPIMEMVDSDDFQVIGMMGGRGGDCSLNAHCVSNGDCESNVCLPIGMCGCQSDVDCKVMALRCNAVGYCEP